jgi:transposase
MRLTTDSSALFGGACPPVFAHRFEESRGSDCVMGHLALAACCRWTIMRPTTGSPEAPALMIANDGVTPAACFAHVRRRFYELHVNESSRLATQTIHECTGREHH